MSAQHQVITEEHARRAHRVLQAIWMIASARHEDAVARDVATLGSQLKSNIDAGDWPAASATLAEIQGWLSSMAGVITSRMQKAFDDE